MSDGLLQKGDSKVFMMFEFEYCDEKEQLARQLLYYKILNLSLRNGVSSETF